MLALIAALLQAQPQGKSSGWILWVVVLVVLIVLLFMRRKSRKV
jgi:FtsH-binding integral membrane protein